MWYKYVNRDRDVLRMFRQLLILDRLKNLNYNHDDYGMFRLKNFSKFKCFRFRLARGEVNLRFVTFCLFPSILGFIQYFRNKYWVDHDQAQRLKLQQQKQQQQNNKKARQQLYYNKFGVPTKPLRSLKEFMTFISSSEATKKVVQYTGFGGKITADQMLGLDSPANQNDLRMIQLIKDTKIKYGLGKH